MFERRFEEHERLIENVTRDGKDGVKVVRVGKGETDMQGVMERLVE
jgi:hypothetical protein